MTTQSDPNVQSIYCIIFAWDEREELHKHNKCRKLIVFGAETQVETFLQLKLHLSKILNLKIWVPINIKMVKFE